MVVVNAGQCGTHVSSRLDMQCGGMRCSFLVPRGLDRPSRYTSTGSMNQYSDNWSGEGGLRNSMVLCRAQQSKNNKKKGDASSGGGFGGFGGGKQSTPKMTCPCGSRKLYGACCGQYHTGVALPPTAEALMRSRYSAYAKGLVDYIVDTTHPDNPLAQKDDGVSLRKDVIATCKKISWDKLVVLETEDVSEGEAYVTFQTYFKVKGQQGQRSQGFHTQSFIEKSRFLKSSDGAWLYENGEQDWEGNQWV